MFTLFHPELHPVFEALGYAGGYGFYRHARSVEGDALQDDRRWLVIAAAAVGALFGSRILGLLEHVPVTGFHWRDFLLPGGKTIVGGLLGGWLGVEIAKWVAGIKTRTGDLFAVALCLGIAIGRIGCFLAGLPDDTYGTPTRMPWGVDFGDGIRRHPTQLYELVLLLALACVLIKLSQRRHVPGAIFRVFMAAYLGWRLGIDFLKPQPHVAGMNVIQWACVVGLVALGVGQLRVQGTARDV